MVWDIERKKNNNHAKLREKSIFAVLFINIMNYILSAFSSKRRNKSEKLEIIPSTFVFLARSIKYEKIYSNWKSEML